MNFPFTRRQMRDFRSQLIERLNGRPGTAISGQDFEETARTAFDCVIPERQRVSGDMDIWDTAGNGSSLKTVLVNERSNRSRIWPEELGRRAVVMPENQELGAGAPAIVEIEHSRYSPRIRRLMELIDGDPQTAGNHLIRQMRDALTRSCEERGVEAATYSVIVRHPDGVRLALAVTPLEIPDPAELTWRWQIEDEADPDAEPTSLEAFTASGELWGRWYVRGGQIRRLLVLESAVMARLRLPRSAR